VITCTWIKTKSLLYEKVFFVNSKRDSERLFFDNEGGCIYYNGMNDRCIYSPDDIRRSYCKIGAHRQSRDTIIRYSTNTLDIREVALAGLDLSPVRNVLDLGCGYGFFSEKLTGVVDRGAHITGIDMVVSNRKPYLNVLSSSGFKGNFVHGSSEAVSTMKRGSFDLVAASYSLYFFPHLIGEIARILSPEGIFIAITHSRFTMREILGFIPSCMKEAGAEPPRELVIEKLFSAFSLENGMSLLGPHFEHVEQIEFNNTLSIPQEDVKHFVAYLDGKKPLFLKDVRDAYPGKLVRVKDCFYRKIHEYSENVKEGLIITKDDGIFRCRRRRG
jgi:SAM-dependent methyltransferase